VFDCYLVVSQCFLSKINFINVSLGVSFSRDTVRIVPNDLAIKRRDGLVGKVSDL
jgi:hypothetical protein